MKAARAAATAWSTSALPASATWAMAVPFDGSTTVKERADHQRHLMGDLGKHPH
ncbi:hypothetical protein OHA25_23625 [Nonomuraea sp. NBC_00507]|uniref:hypothetical protein n=1 Tax=Nonomuraea sp. NBC_00507 TaxID=2976002 RepID=UPI002E189A3C